MLTRSNEYKTIMQELQISQTGLVIVDLSDDVEYPLATSATASTTEVGYDADCLIDGLFKPSEIAYSGAYIPAALQTAGVGWKGTKLSNSLGVLSVPEVLTITYPNIDSGNFWLVGTAVNYPVDFTMSVVHAGGTSVVPVTGNDLVLWGYNCTKLIDVSSVVFTITKISMPDGDQAIIMEAGAVTKVVFGPDSLISMAGTDEVSAMGDTVGSITSNECSVTFSNEEFIFVMSNTESPFFNLMKPDIRFKPFIGVEVTAGIYEMMPMGTFRSTDWNSDNNSMDFTLTGYDRISDYNEEPSPKLLPAQNTTLVEYIQSINVAGALNMVIDDIPDSTPLFCYSLQSKLRPLLEELAEAIPGPVFIDKVDQLRLTSYNFEVDSTPAATWTDGVEIIKAKNPQKFNTAFSTIVIKKRNVKDIPNQQVAFVKSAVLDTAILELTNMPFTDNVLYIESVSLEGSIQTTIGDLKANPVEYNLTLDNNGLATDTVTVTINACTFNENPTDLTYRDPTYEGVYFKSLVIDNPLFQLDTQCNDYAIRLFSISAKPTNEYAVEVWLDPAIELLDQVIINAPSERINNVQIVILSVDWSWEGALTATIKGKRVE